MCFRIVCGFVKIRIMRLSSYKSSFSIWKRFVYGTVQKESSGWIEPVGGFTTNINVYNPIKKCKVPLILKNKEKFATWYMCGPTVYDSAHIGHACTYVRFDIIRRILERFFNVNAITIMGITDIDDKIIKRSLELKQDWKQLTKRYEQEFFDEMQLLNVIPPYLYCRVTDYVPEIIYFVEKILSTNSAYIGKDGSVYFDTSRYVKYGKLCKPQPSESHPIKKSTTDFALWKASKPGEPFWDSPWGPGRPGWHIECSAIASATLGSSIDIHSGGIDLMFPHHENEEAQSCRYHRIDQWVNYWLHSGHLYLTGDEKMSKSLQNTINIRELLERYSSNQFRLFCLLTHYRTGIEFSHDKMKNAVTIWYKFENFLSDCRFYVAGKLNVGNVDETVVLHNLQVTREKVYAALADDFDTTKAISAIQELVAIMNKMINEPEGIKKNSTSKNTSCIAAVAQYVRETFMNLGFSENVDSKGNENQLNEIIDNFVNFRQTVRNTVLEQAVKDKSLLNACDEARNNLSACGVKVKDHKNTSTWTLMKN